MVFSSSLKTLDTDRQDRQYDRAMENERLAEQMGFLVEADKLKTVIRRTPLTDNSRLENSAEHSWHLALAAMTLSEHAPPGLDLGRVLQLVTVHDLVEIDAGDTFAYDVAGHETKVERERAAADQIFGRLPADQSARFRALWEEFEAHHTTESRFANALDRLQALLQNMEAGGGSWTVHGVTRGQVLTRMAPVEAALPGVWPFVLDVIDRFCASGAILEGG
jgi:putative hydrolase of HD superfamily